MESVSQFLQKVTTIIVNPIIVLLFAVALVVFLWGLFEFIKGSDSSDARSKGVQHIFWGLIGMAIMVSVFGIINILLDTFEISGENARAVNQILPR